jgi:hypothetical protein
MLSDGPPSTEDAVAVLAGKYGVEFGQPEWLPDVIARFGLTPPPGV